MSRAAIGSALLGIALLGVWACATPARSAGPIPDSFEAIRVAPIPAADPERPPALAVSLWGRELRFRAGPLPESIVSQGTELLAVAPRLELQVDGRALPIDWEAVQVQASGPDAVQLATQGSAGALRVRAATRIEYDGMILVELSFGAERDLRVERFAYEFELPREVARSFNHHVPYDYTALNVDKKNMLSAAGAVPERRAFPFVPTLFVGNREVGLEWWGETDAFWSGPEDRRPIEVGRRAETGYLRVEPIVQPMALVAGDVWSETFGLFPAPYRRPPSRWREVRFGYFGARPRAYQGHLRRVWVAFARQARARWFGLPASRGGAEHEAQRAKLARDGVDYVPYATLTAAPMLHPCDSAEAGAVGGQRPGLDLPAQ